MAVIGNAPFQGLVSGGNIIDASIEGVDLSTSAIAARLGYTPVDPGAAVFSANPTISSGVANGVAYLNGSKVVTSSSALTFDGNTNFSLTGTGLYPIIAVYPTGNNAIFGFRLDASAGNGIDWRVEQGRSAVGDFNIGAPTVNSTPQYVILKNLSAQYWSIGSSEQMRLASTGLETKAGIKVNTVGTATSGFANAINMGTWDAFGYNAAGTDVVLGGYRVSQFSAIGFYTDGTERMRLTASGLTAASINVTNLSVGPSSGVGGINVGSSAGRAQYQYINFGGAQGGTDYAWQIGRSPSGGVGPADGFYIYDLKGSATRVAIDNSGNVGIGASSPLSLLDVAGTSTAISQRLRTTSSASTNVALLIQDGTTGFTDGDGLYLGRAGAVNYLWTYENEPLVFATSNTERLRIASNGNVTIGSAIAATNVVLNFNGVANKAKRIVFQDSGVEQWLIGSGAASENDAFEIYNANGQMALSFAKASSNATFVGSVITSRLNVTNNSAYAIQVDGTGLVQDAPSGNNDHIATARVRIGYMRSTNIGTISSNGGDSGLSLVTHSSSTGWKESVRIQPDGSVGIGTTNPAYKLHVNGSTYVNGTFLHSALASYPQQSISLSVGTSTWIKLFTITSPGGCRVRYNCGSNNSEEQGEFSVKGTYVAAGTQITWSRQTYYHNLNEIRVTGSNSTPYTVWALIRTSDFIPSFNWQVIEALNSVTLHNTTGETPGSAVASISNPTYSSTNFNHDVTVSSNVGIGTVAPTAKLHVKGLAGNAMPFINFETVSPNSTFNWVSQAMASNLASGNNLVHFIGQDPSTKNSGYIGYKHSSNASDNNILTFGLYGVDNVLNITGAGKVGINVQEPLHTLDVNGSLGVNDLYGRTQRYTDGGNIDLTEYNANNFIILEVFGSINPNAGGSAYVDPIHMYVYVGRGWNGSALTSYIYVQHVAPPARDVYPSGGGAGNAIAAVWTNGSTELDTVDAGTTSYYVRLKAYNYNSSFGSGFNVRVIRRA